MVAKLDMIFIAILMITVSIIFGMNIISLIDRKISNVSINIPPIKVPQPHVTVHIHKNKNDINVDSNTEVTVIDDKKKQKKNKKRDKVDKHENFAGNIGKISKVHGIGLDVNNSASNILGPNKDDIVDYTKNINNNKNKDNDGDNDVDDNENKDNDGDNDVDDNENISKVLNDGSVIISLKNAKGKDDYNAKENKQLSCNKFISKKFTYGNKQMKARNIDCGSKITPQNFYKHYKPVIAHMNDPKMMGSNYGDYNNNVSPQDLGRRLLPNHNKKLYPHHSKIDKLPKGMNYIFENTPSFK